MFTAYMYMDAGHLPAMIPVLHANRPGVLTVAIDTENYKFEDDLDILAAALMAAKRAHDAVEDYDGMIGVL